VHFRKKPQFVRKKRKNPQDNETIPLESVAFCKRLNFPQEIDSFRKKNHIFKKTEFVRKKEQVCRKKTKQFRKKTELSAK